MKKSKNFVNSSAQKFAFKTFNTGRVSPHDDISNRDFIPNSSKRKLKSEFFRNSFINNPFTKNTDRRIKIPFNEANNIKKVPENYTLLWARIKITLKKMFMNAFLPHISATFILMLIVGIRNNLIPQICFMDNSQCRSCSAGVKLFYMIIMSYEYLIPILYGYYICFYTNKFKNFHSLSILTMIIYYVMLGLWFFFWDYKLFSELPEKTVDNLIYASLFLLNGFIILPYLKKISGLSWIQLVIKVKYHTIMLAMGSSAFILFINILHWFQEGLRNKSEAYQNLYQVCLMIFCVGYESGLLFIMVRHHPTLIKDWQKNNTPLLFIAKNILIFSYAIRLANIAVLDSSQFGFYLQIITFAQYILEMLSGHSLIDHIVKKIKLSLSKQKNKEVRVLNLFKFNRGSNEENLLCLRIMSYQKIEFMLLYFPRVLYLILYNKWSLSEPFNKLVEGCNFSINSKIKINGGNLIMMMGIDIALTVIFLRRMLKRQQILRYIKFQTEDLPFHYKVILFIAFQICFEYWFHYYINMIYV